VAGLIKRIIDDGDGQGSPEGTPLKPTVSATIETVDETHAELIQWSVWIPWRKDFVSPMPFDGL
jgi:hypothetical protein